MSALAEIWREVLGISEVFNGDNFFVLGGESLQAFRAVAEVRRLGIDVRLRDLFECPTLESFARRVAKSPMLAETEFPPAPAKRRLVAPASLAQDRYVRLHADPNMQQFRPALMNVAFRIEGNLDLERLRLAVDLVVRRHDILRTSFIHRDDSVFQVIEEAVPSILNLSVLNVYGARAAEELLEHAIRDEIG